MKWFTREWTLGRLSEEEAEAIPARYAEHLDEIAPRLAPDALGLARHVNIQDGRVKRLLQTGTTVELDVVGGDLQSGYEWVSLTFEAAQLLSPLPNDTIDFAHPKTELLYDEVDLTDDGPLEYRVLIWPDGELIIRFASVTVTTTSASAPDR